MTNSKLIYIEDDQILGNLITQALVDYGFEIDFRTTLNGLQESLASMLPDLLILDIEVNNQSCLDILPAIRSQYPQLPIIIASSHTNGAKIIVMTPEPTITLKSRMTLRNWYFRFKTYCNSPKNSCLRYGKSALIR